MYKSKDFEEDGYRKLAYKTLSNRTVVHDLNHNRAILIIEGVVVLPVGTSIDLVDPNINVEVESIRLLAGSEAEKRGYEVCLEVRVPDEYYDQNAK